MPQEASARHERRCHSIVLPAAWTLADLRSTLSEPHQETLRLGTVLCAG